MVPAGDGATAGGAAARGARPVVVLGDVNVDLVVDLPDRSLPAADRIVREPRLTGGGTAGNTAAALARLGVPVEFAGAVGDDGFGRFLVGDFAAVGVGTAGLVVTDAAPTCQVLALVEPDGERYLVVWPLDGGALVHLGADDLDPALVAGAAWLHTTGMCLRASPVRETVLAM
ncbi:MAG: carbohydrate kinase family protein, partial [Chloroflexota bacterium]